MSYAIAAYSVTVGILVVYGLHLARERRRLRGELDRSEASRPD